jgi:hypothetical protein
MQINETEKDIPIFQNSIIRTVIIEKEEYYLHYKHNKIENYTKEDILETPLCLGKLYLTRKQIKKGGIITQYFTEEKSKINLF